MIHISEKIKVAYEMEITLKMIGGKCKPLILYHLIENGKKRYGELYTVVDHIPKKTLTSQLRDMEADGLIERIVLSESPLKVEYCATKLGKSLYPILELMCDWGYQNIGDRFEVTKAQCTGED